MPGLRADHLQNISNLDTDFSAGIESLENLRDIVPGAFHKVLLPVPWLELLEVSRQFRNDMQDVQAQAAGIRHPKRPLEHLKRLGTQIERAQHGRVDVPRQERAKRRMGGCPDR